MGRRVAPLPLALSSAEIPFEGFFHGLDEREALAGEETDHRPAPRTDVAIF